MKRVSLSLKASLTGALALLLLLLVGQGLFALSSIDGVYGDVQTLATKWVPSVDTANKINITMADLRGSQTRLLLASDAAAVEKTEHAIVEDMTALRERISTYGTLISAPEERTRCEAFNGEKGENRHETFGCGLGFAWHPLHHSVWFGARLMSFRGSRRFRP